MSVEATMNKTMSSTWSLSSDGKLPTSVDERSVDSDDDNGEDEDTKVVGTIKSLFGECEFETRPDFPFPVPLPSLCPK